MLALAATLAIQALVTMTVLTPPVLAPVAAPALGLAPNDVGLLMAVIYAGATVASIGSGALLRRWGAMRVSQLCLVLCAGGSALLAPAMLALVPLAALVIGFGYGPVTPASSHILIRQAPPARRALVFSIKQTGVPLGGVLAGSIVPPLILAFGWEGAALAVGGGALALAALVQPLVRRFDAGEGAPSGGPGLFAGVRLVLRDRVLRALSVAFFTYAMAQLAFSTFLVALLTTRFHYDIVRAGAVLAAGQVAGVPARILWGWLADRLLPPLLILTLLGGVMAAALLAIVLIEPDAPGYVVIAIAVVHGVTAIGWNGVSLAEVARLAPAGEAGSATGGALAFAFLGIVLGPPVISLLVALTGSYVPGFAFSAAAASGGGLACLLAWRGRRADAAPRQP